MRGKRLSIGFRAAIATLGVALFAAIPCAAQQETVLYSLGNGTDGALPLAGLIFDGAGKLYGTASIGGSNGLGAVFELSPQQGGGYTGTVLHSFGSGTDGQVPYAVSLIFDSAGNLYGTTQFGGTYNAGTVFELSPNGQGSWTEKVLYIFGNGTYDGQNPFTGLIFDADGNLYGTTYDGGLYTYGTAFELSPAEGGSWTETVLFSFGNGMGIGRYPRSQLIFDAAGNLYGVCKFGGLYGYGTAFELSPNGQGGWTGTTLHTFNDNGSDGYQPLGALILDAAGNLYGTTSAGGIYCSSSGGCGTVFELSPTGGGTWTETVLHSFGNGTDGQFPLGALIFDASGDLYGTTSAGGVNNFGTVFKMSPQTGGGYAETVLHAFGGSGDGTDPWSNLIFDHAGNLYGTTRTGGIYCSGAGGCGTVFELAPPKIPTTTTLMSSANPSTVGEPVTFTATVSPAGPPIPTGTVGFTANGTTIAGCSAVPVSSSRTAACTTAALAAGSNAIVATYSGDANYAGSTGSLSQVVNKGASTTTVTSGQNPSTFGEPVTLTATVGPAGPPIPTGTVGFTSNGTTITGCSAVVLSPSRTATCTTTTLAVGTDTIAATYSGDSNYLPSNGAVSQIVNPVPTPVQFVPLTPCRVVDTRNADGTFGGPAIGGNSFRSFPLSLSGNPCAIPSSAIAYSLNVTVLPQTTLGYLTIWPSGEGQPIVSTMNSPDGRIKANAAIVPAGMPSGSVSVYVTNTTNVILDIDGYFAAPTQGSLQFYTLTPCRIVDTRNGQEHGMLQAGVERDYTIAGTCGVPSSAMAYSFNVTVLPARGGLDYLTVWPQGESQPVVSTLNDNTGTVVANAAIVPAGSKNATAFYAHSNATNLLVDVNGYFAAPGTDGLSLYPVTPCRVLDTRQNNGQPFSGEKIVNIEGSACAPPANAAAYIFNATVVPPGPMLFLSLWPDGESQPTVSTLNAEDGFITSNMAIVPTLNGSIDAYAAALTQLLLDISGYFAP